MRQRLARLGLCLALPVSILLLAQERSAAQDRLKSLPGYSQYQRMAPLISGAVKSGSLTVTWNADGRSFEYTKDGKRYRFDIASRQETEIGAATDAPEAERPARGGRTTLDRGRQYTSADSPDTAYRAQYKEADRNLYLVDRLTGAEFPITTDGSRERRVKYGTASWVYGEELDQNTAIWWSPDSRRVAFYRFDESAVPDYYLQIDQTKLQSAVEVEAYPKAGTPNPVVDLLVYDLQTKRTTKVDVRDGKPFDNTVVGHYAYRVLWSPDGRELLFSRTNRRQNVMELVAADPGTGAVRVIVREEWPTGWVENSPEMAFLNDGRRFVWKSERSGWSNLYLYDLSGNLIRPLTVHETFEVSALVKIDESAGALFYTARDGENHLKTQLHRVGLDGEHDVRLTDPRFHHTIGGCVGKPFGRRVGAGIDTAGCGISPDSRYAVVVYQTHNTPPATRVIDASTGATVSEIAASDMARYQQLGFRKAELFTFTSADGGTTLHGIIQFPSNFDPSRKYPVLLPVYGGPSSSSNSARETFVRPHQLAEYGFLIVNLDTRNAPGRGKRVHDQVYLKLGQVEVDDLAAGIRALATRPYVDAARVGIYGTSYGGYTSLMAVLRYPGLFAAASASSPVTAWYHYDTIYTERYMWIPQENKAGYEAGSAMTYARHLKGRLMLYFGTADNNVHPSNTMQLIAALQAAGKSFDVQIGPDRGHTSLNTDRMMEFFIEHLLPSGMAPAVAF